MDSLSDTELVERAKQGDGSAFEQLVYRHQDRLVHSLELTTGSRDDALEIAQHAFVSAWKHLGTFRSEAGFYSWLYRIARNCAITHHRRNRLPTVSLDSIAESRGFDTADHDHQPSPSHQMERDDDLQLLRQAMSQIPEEFREALILKEIDGLSYEEIAGLLEIPMGTVRSRIFRARQELADRMRRMQK